MSRTSVYEMIIELRSDMCCGTGEANGVSVDQVTALDVAGLPIVPAKRLKGLLREAALLIGQPSVVESLFGKAGEEHAGKLLFNDARLVGCEQLAETIARNGVTPGMASGVFTTSRTGTRVEDDGIAADHTLRTIQLVRRCDTAGVPTRFDCQIRGIDLDVSEKELLEDAVSCLRSIGLGKNRGMGEVTCSGEWVIADAQVQGGKQQSVRGTVSQTSDARMGYRITLEGPAVVQSGTGASLDYVPGSVMQGICASLFAKTDADFLAKHVLQGTRFLNAYVDVCGEMSAPVPLTLRAEKNAQGMVDKNGDAHYTLYDSASDVSDAHASGPSVQQVPIHGYASVVDGEYTVADVAQSLSFHSSKSTSMQGRQYYSYRSMDKGQSFSGAIVAEGEVLRRLEERMGQHRGQIRIGTAKGAGFGACDVSFFGLDEPSVLNLGVGDRVVIHLVSDVVFIDSKGKNSTDVLEFARHLSSDVLSFSFNATMDASDDACRAYCKTCVVGGFNAHWRLPKRQYMAFQKGSVIVAKVTSCDQDCVSSEAWVGLLQPEGFGRLVIQKLDDSNAIGGRKFRRVDPCFGVTSSSSAPKKSARLVELEKQAVVSFERDLALSEALEVATYLACMRGDAFDLESASKSSFMRISSLLGTAEKTACHRSLCDEFTIGAQNNFGEDNELLRTQCEDLVCEARGLLSASKYSKLDARSRDLVFKRYVLEFLHQVKVRYSLAKGEVND